MTVCVVFSTRHKTTWPFTNSLLNGYVHVGLDPSTRIGTSMTHEDHERTISRTMVRAIREKLATATLLKDVSQKLRIAVSDSCLVSHLFL